jgi:5'-nucleotidase
LKLANVTAPVISANIVTNDTQLASRIKPYHIFEEHSLAVIGLTTIHTRTTSRPDAGTEFLDPAEVLQRMVDEINVNHKVERIVAMTHIGTDQGFHSVLASCSRLDLTRLCGGY